MKKLSRKERKILEEVRGIVTKIELVATKDSEGRLIKGSLYDIDPGKRSMVQVGLLGTVQPFCIGEEVIFHVSKRRNDAFQGRSSSLFYGQEDGSVEVVQAPVYKAIVRYKRLDFKI